MNRNNKFQNIIMKNINEYNFHISDGDSIQKIKDLKDASIKLLYGSPPYPNAKRNYKTWKIDNYIEEITPFIENAIPKLTSDGFIVLNVKSNRTHPKNNSKSSERSLVIEELMLHMKKNLHLFCVDIEIWIKSNPVPTGLRVACQDAYEYILWFSKSPKWSINIDLIRRKYSETSLKIYEKTLYKPRSNGLQYISREKKITPNQRGALPINVTSDEIDRLAEEILKKDLKNELINNFTNLVYGSVSNKSIEHQAVQPDYLPEKYILACTNEDDIILDPWVGSGTTGLVALKLNRKFIGFDISKDFSELASKNINEYLNLNKTR